MLAKCANPSCSTPFRYLEAGKLFRLEDDPREALGAHKPEYFWLCSNCSESMTLRLDESTGVRLVAGGDLGTAVENPVDFVLLDRRKGQLLNTVSFWSHWPNRRKKSRRGGSTRI
jgi:hypothetical protein